jgi:endonuclease/exonuclease/phosphatase family metal-dependent hydrolase
VTGLEQESQAAELLDFVESELRPLCENVVLGGDLNCTPGFCAVRMLQRGLRGAAVGGGGGGGGGVPGQPTFPLLGASVGIKLDYCWAVGPELRAGPLVVVADEASDHLPVVCEVGVAVAATY